MGDPRKATIPDRLATLRDLTADSGDKLARECFSLDVVMGAMTAAATEGQPFALVEPPKPVDLRGTATWKDTAEKLQAMGFTVEPRELPSHLPVGMSWGLLVSWVE